MRIFKFQSLIGFKINWNTGKQGYAICTDKAKFQSLIGFKINWNCIRKKTCIVCKQFQSLVGFKIYWNGQKYILGYHPICFNP